MLTTHSADIFEMAELVTRVVDIPSSRALGKDARTGLQPHVPRLQPYVTSPPRAPWARMLARARTPTPTLGMRAATICSQALQPPRTQAATVCTPGCNPVYLQARTSASTMAYRPTSTRGAQTLTLAPTLHTRAATLRTQIATPCI